jgi:signal transduction histidine kinase/CheY-like chemotaxis protein
VVLVPFLWTAHRAVETTLVTAGGERARTAADQIARLLDGQRTVAELRRISLDPDLQRYLRERTRAAEAIVRARLKALPATGPRRMELWDPSGTRLLEVPIPEQPGQSAKQLPPIGGPGEPGIHPLQRAGNLTYSDMVAAIHDTSELASGAGARLLGYLVIRSTFTVNPPGIIARLVGPDAIVTVGNRVGGAWSDFDNAVAPPPIDLTRVGVAEYRGPDNQTRVGALAEVKNTPWVAWVEFPHQRIVAPAGTLLSEMIALAAVFLVVAGVLTWVVAARITGPVIALSRAAAAIAAGDYSQRVTANRPDEVGQLGRAFNVMAGEVEAAQERLEARVAARTEELAAARLEAERANQAKSAFLSGMSHDLRTPLNAILGFAQILEIDERGADRGEPVRQILSGGRYLLELINEVLDITRIESGQLSLSPEPVLVRDVVQRSVELVRPLAAQRGITLTVEPFAPDDTVKADKQRLGQVLLNLLSNALKYNAANGRVIISTQQTSPDRYRIAVTDTGAGIPESKLALLFQPFERLGAEESAIEGTGLGLALSRALAEAMGGTLGVDSVVDRGSTFWVELAVATPHAVRESAVSVPHEPPTDVTPARSGSILYVEDNLPNVRLMERILRQRPGVELLHAPQAGAGFDAICRRRPDVVLLDLHLPDMSGEDMLRRLWEDPVNRQIPTVIVTADATPGLARRLKAGGATAVLTKPLNVKDVLRLVDELLNPVGTRDV